MGVTYKMESLEIIQIGGSRVKEKLRSEFKNTRARTGNGWVTGATETAIDYSINNLRGYLNDITIEISWQIWQALINADGKEARAWYSPNRQYKPKDTESELIEYLKAYKWIPDKSGNFQFPRDMTEETLHENFVYDDSNGLLSAIGFGEKAQNNNIEQTIVEEWMLNNGGCTIDDYKIFLDLKGRGLLPRPELSPFPKDPQLVNLERRTEQLIKQYNLAPRKKYPKKSISTRSTKGTIDKSTYLINKYKNERGQLICQICKCPMPFKKRNDVEYYFEAVEAFSRKYFSREYEAQYLALCPECAARYNEFVIKDEENMALFNKAILTSQTPEIPLKLGDWSTSVRFIKTHFYDIKTILGFPPEEN